MSPTDLNLVLTFGIELLFVAVFVRALVEYGRHRDPLTGELALVFSAMTALFIVQLANRAASVAVPGFISAGAAVLLLLQPLFTLRLVGRLRPISRALFVAPLAAYAAVIALAAATGGFSNPVIGGLIVLVFFATESSAGAYLALEAVDHAGAARYRLFIAAAATLTFGGALLLAGAGMLGPTAKTVGSASALVLALVAGAGYVIAFMPPRWLRRIWQSGAGYRYTEELLASGAADGTHELWAHFSATARASSGSDAVAVIIAREGQATEFESDRLAPPPRLPEIGEFEDMLRALPARVQLPIAAAPPFIAEMAGSIGARFFSLVRIPLRETGRGVIVLFTEWRTLFTADDSELIAATGAQTALLAERQGLLAHQRHLTDELSVTVRALESASRAKSDFLASMSHELRTPLNAIIGFSELMRGEPADGGTLHVPTEWVEHIHSSGQHLLGLINDVLDITKVEAGRLDLHLETIDVAQAITESVAGLRPLAERKGIPITVEAPRGTIEADRGRLRQILYNLLSNAIKFTATGGSIRISAALETDVVRIAVADSGVGIAPVDRDHVFEEFRQVGDVASRQEGTGLGLALTRRLVEAHGGSIDLESVVGRGTTFTVVLPRVARPEVAVDGTATHVAPATAVSPTTPAEPVPAAGAGQPLPIPETLILAMAQASGDDSVSGHISDSRPPTVLVIEDEPSAVRLLRTYIEGAGVAVRVANDGESGLSTARDEPPEAIVLDVLLPGMDGWEVLRELKSDPRLRDIPVIIVTIVDERDVGLALGAVDYFVKPVERAALLARLDRYTFTTKVKQREVRILAVDDDPAAVAMVEAALGPEGFTIVPAYDGRQAVQLAREEPPDLVICDLLMPDLDGFGVVSALKSEPRTAEVPILILTAHELSSAEKSRLNGKILGVVGKGEAAARGLREWLVRVGARAPDFVDQRGQLP